MASRRDALGVSFDDPVVSFVPPVVSLRSTTGYRLRSRWDHGFDVSDVGGISSCSRWLSVATPPDPDAPKVSTPAGVPANVHASGRFTEHHFVGVNKMVPRPIPCSVGLRPSHSVRRIGEPATVTDSRYKELEVLNPKARELEARIAENVGEMLEA